jgi:hypothetical protein
MTDDIMNSKCEGCNTNGPDNSCPWFKETIEIVCPCSICLVKVMCSGRCGLFIRHQIKVLDSDSVVEEWI